MKTVAVVANARKGRAAEVLARLVAEASDLGLTVCVDPATMGLLGPNVAPISEGIEHAEALVTLGGDGTLLRAVRELGDLDLPILGVNMGKLGFLTSVSEDDLTQALQCLATDTYCLNPCALAEVGVWRGDLEVGRYRAMNDVVVGSESFRIVSLDLHVGNDRVTSYACDALIISTPAGSTGHSLSAGGPVLTWDTEAFVVSLICPHTLSSRPLVVPDRHRLMVTARESDGGFRLTVDGQVSQSLEPGDRVVVEHGDRHVRLMTLPGYSYFDVLREKLRWSGSSV